MIFIERVELAVRSCYSAVSELGISQFAGLACFARAKVAGDLDSDGKCSDLNFYSIPPSARVF